MAISTVWAARVFECAFNKEIDMDADTIKIRAYIAAGFDFNTDNDKYLADIGGTQLSGGGYTEKTMTATGTNWLNYDAANNRFYIDAQDVTWSSLETDTSGIPRYFVMYDDSPTSKPLIAVIDLGDSTTGIRHSADLVLQWNSSGIVGVTVS